ncbi:MAG: MvaI/BcnI restriction endonuclease family protein [Bacteroidales bacterium]|nr:MvaI/BcnI restriction endonuclease family protein [Bacteroidales bacterium]
MTNRDLISNKFRRVKKMGYVRSHRTNNTGIGKTFEDLIGVTENNLAQPDFAGYEIKSHRDSAQSYVTLFTKCPSFPRGANSYLRNKFGIPYEDFPEIKQLHTSMFANKPNNFGGKYSFQLINDRKKRCIFIAVYSLRTKKMLDCSCGYSYDALNKVLKRKLKNLFYVSAQSKKDKNGKEAFYFDKAEIFEQPSITNFINLIDNGIIMFDIRIGAYKSGKYFGKTHDHGSGFRIKEKDLPKLYSWHQEVK